MRGHGFWAPGMEDWDLRGGTGVLFWAKTASRRLPDACRRVKMRQDGPKPPQEAAKMRPRRPERPPRRSKTRPRGDVGDFLELK